MGWIEQNNQYSRKIRFCKIELHIVASVRKCRNSEIITFQERQISVSHFWQFLKKFNNFFKYCRNLELFGKEASVTQCHHIIMKYWKLLQCFCLEVEQKYDFSLRYNLFPEILTNATRLSWDTTFWHHFQIAIYWLRHCFHN